MTSRSEASKLKELLDAGFIQEEEYRLRLQELELQLGQELATLSLSNPHSDAFAEQQVLPALR